MAIFAGDIPGALLRIPGTPASAAYTDEAYAMTLKGHAETALGAGLVFSAIGGLFGTVVMILFSPGLAEIALPGELAQRVELALIEGDVGAGQLVRYPPGPSSSAPSASTRATRVSRSSPAT